LKKKLALVCLFLAESASEKHPRRPLDRIPRLFREFKQEEEMLII